MSFAEGAQLLESGVRLLVAGAFVVSLIVAGVHWGVRRGTITPFGALARLVRRLSDPVLRPLERRIVRAGGNPQDAPFWLLAIAVIGGLGVIALVSWLVDFVAGIVFRAHFGSGALLAMLVEYTFSLLMAALIWSGCWPPGSAWAGTTGGCGFPIS